MVHRPEATGIHSAHPTHRRHTGTSVPTKAAPPRSAPLPHGRSRDVSASRQSCENGNGRQPTLTGERSWVQAPQLSKRTGHIPYGLAWLCSASFAKRHKHICARRHLWSCVSSRLRWSGACGQAHGEWRGRAGCALRRRGSPAQRVPCALAAAASRLVHKPPSATEAAGHEIPHSAPHRGVALLRPSGTPTSCAYSESCSTTLIGCACSWSSPSLEACGSSSTQGPKQWWGNLMCKLRSLVMWQVALPTYIRANPCQ